MCVQYTHQDTYTYNCINYMRNCAHKNMFYSNGHLILIVLWLKYLWTVWYIGGERNVRSSGLAVASENESNIRNVLNRKPLYS